MCLRTQFLTTQGANNNLEKNRRIFFFVSSNHKYVVTHAKSVPGPPIISTRKCPFLWGYVVFHCLRGEKLCMIYQKLVAFKGMGCMGCELYTSIKLLCKKKGERKAGRMTRSSVLNTSVLVQDCKVLQPPVLFLSWGEARRCFNTSSSVPTEELFKEDQSCGS